MVSWVTVPATVLLSAWILSRITVKMGLLTGPMSAIVLATVLLGVYAVYEIFGKRRRLPPGPTPWLLAGNMPAFVISSSIDELFLNWKRRFGPIFTVWIGPIPLVMVCDLATIKKYFIQHADSFSNRWRNFVTDSIMEGANGVVQIDGDKWREQRRFALHTLRDFGVGRPLMEQKIMLEVEALTEYLGKNAAKTENWQDLCSPLANCVGNIINNMLFSVRLRQGDRDMTRLHRLLDRQSQIVMKSVMGVYITCPWTTRIPVINSKWIELMSIKRELCDFLDQQIQDHREKWAESMMEQDVEDLTYAYMKEVERRKKSGDDVGFFDDKQLQMLLLDLFFAGMETTVTTLKWAFLLVAKNGEVQRRVQRELDALGGHTQITLAQKTQLPYTQATLNEIQRVANILPINLLRTVAADTKIDGFEFRKGDLIIPQVSILMNDPEIFDEPHIFNPDRFLDENYNVKKIDEFLPFSIGRRQCLGESLARAELFLIFANLLKSFHFDVEHDASTARILGLTVSPPVYKCRLQKRNINY